jgi:hypothetical protein
MSFTTKDWRERDRKLPMLAAEYQKRADTMEREPENDRTP